MDAGSTADDGILASGGTIQWLTASDGLRLRTAGWPGRGAGPALLLHGRTEFMEKYLETVQELRSRGHAVWSLDWRGQGRSGRLLADPVSNHVRSFDDHLADLRLLVAGMPAEPLLLVAQSMGAHLGLRLAAGQPGRIGRAVLVTPMVDFLRPRHLPWLLARAMTLAACGAGLGGRAGPGTRRLPDPARPFAGNPLTSCPDRFAADLAFLHDPGLAVGGATWGWLRAATASVGQLRRRGVAEGMRLPVLMLLAGADRIVDNRAARAFAARLPDAEVIELPGARHELLREHDRHRHLLWAAVDRFLARTA